MQEARTIEITFDAKLQLFPAAAHRRENSAARPIGDSRQLLSRIAAGDPDALGLAYDLHAASLYRLLGAMLGPGTDAEDALQEVFLKLATARLVHVRDLRSYLLAAARHQALDTLRRRKRESTLVEQAFPQHEIETLPTPPAPAEPTYDWHAMLCTLPLEQREVIALKVWEQLTFAEIAVIVKAPPNTVMSRYRYAIERLRACCREEDARDA